MVASTHRLQGSPRDEHSTIFGFLLIGLISKRRSSARLDPPIRKNRGVTLTAG